MKSTIQDIPVIIGVILFGLGALAAIVFLSFYDHVVPSEITAIPSVAIGILGGVVVGAKRGDNVGPNQNVKVENPNQ